MAIYIGINTTNKKHARQYERVIRESNVVQHHQTGATLTPTRASCEHKDSNNNDISTINRLKNG